MSKFVIECPNCGKYAEGKTGFFARKKIDCACGHTIDVRTEKMASRTCSHCGNEVIFDQSKGENATCPVCHEKISAGGNKGSVQEFSCGQCGVRLRVDRAAEHYICPVCDFDNDIPEQLMKEKIKADGLASIIKYEGDNDTLVWKHPIEDFNFGSQLIVHESQEAIFFRDGQALDLFGAGRYTLETQQLPMLEKLYKLPTDTEGTFHSEIYYFNKATVMGIKWGTSEKVTLIDPLTNAPIAVGARGLVNLRIADSRKLLVKVVGTTGGLTKQDILGDGAGAMRNYFRSVIQTGVSTHLANAIREQKLDILQIDQHRLVLSDVLKQQLTTYFAEYGMEIANFLVEGIMLPQPGDLGYDSVQTIIKLRQKDLTKATIETQTDIQLAEQEAKKRLEVQQQQNLAEIETARRGLVSEQGETNILEAQLAGRKKVAETSADVAAERMRMELELERKEQMARIEAAEMAAKGYTQRDVLQAEVQKSYAEGIGNMGPAVSAGGGGSGIVGDMLNLGVGMAAAGAVAPQIGEMMKGFQPGNAGAAAPSAGWSCVCGQTGITGNFCPNCGTKKPTPTFAGTWTCPTCGQAGITGNFCSNCGAKKPTPAAPATWNCACGQTDVSGNFCPNCGAKRPE